MAYDNPPAGNQAMDCEQTTNSFNNKLKNMIARRDHLQRMLDKLNKQIRMAHEHPVIEEFLKLEE